MSIEETDGVDDVVSEHVPVSAASVHVGHPRVEDPVDRENDLFSLLAVLACLGGVVGILILGIIGGITGVR